MAQACRRLDLIVAQDSVDRSVDLGPVAMGVIGEALDVGQRVCRRVTSTETLGADVHRVGTAVDGGDAEFQILGGCEQFDGRHS